MSCINKKNSYKFVGATITILIYLYCNMNNNKNISISKLKSFAHEGNWLLRNSNWDTLNVHHVNKWTHIKNNNHWKRFYPVALRNMNKDFYLSWLCIHWASQFLWDDNLLNYQYLKELISCEKTRLRRLKELQDSWYIAKISKWVYYLNPNIISNKDVMPKHVIDLFNNQKDQNAITEQQ